MAQEEQFMSDYHAQPRSIPTGRADMAVDAGLRAFMLGIYNKMAIGLALIVTEARRVTRRTDPASSTK